MKIRSTFYPLMALGLVMGIVSCNNTKYLPANESLYTGAEIKVEAPELSKKKEN